MEYNSKSLTREGATMLALADQEEKALIIDEVIVSEKVITAGTDISTLTMADFTSPLTYGISSKVQSDNQFSVKSVITNHWQDSANTDHTTNKDFNVALVGVVAHVDGYVDQHVLTVAVGNDPFVLPAYQGTDVSFVFGITQAYSASQNVTIKMDGSAYALATDLDDVKNLQGSIGIAIDSKLKDYAKKDEVQNLIPDDIATTKNLADGDATTLKSAKDYADTQASGKADDSKVVHKTGDEEISGSKTFDTAPVDKTTGNPYITVTDLNNGLSTKVTDNKDGTEQLNGSKVQPFNKLSDTIGGRNYFLNSNQPITVSDGGTNNRFAVIPTKLNTLSAGNYIFTADVSGLVGNQTSLTIGLSNPNDPSDNYSRNVPIIDGTVTKKTTITDDDDIHTNVIIYCGSNDWAGSAGCTAIYTNYQLIKSDVLKDWTPAPEDKVNVSDMRKPASDVAGIEEVNAKQDKIGYTPANAANVVDRNPDTGVVSKPTDFTNLTVNGGKSVATSDDLKSLEASAWRQLDNQYVTRSADGKSFRKAGDDSSVLYKIDEEKKFIYFSFIIYNPGEVTLLNRIDFSSIVKNISFPGYSTFHISNISSGAGNSYYQISIANNQIQISGSASSLYVSSVSAEYQKTSSSGWEYSRCFVSYDELV
ncbi:hypothetical protein EFM42_05635 [Levilactobacillus brevis]|uniref:hypothetical protein n=2 Tax=Levilactobacillus brevis TaxID=1580 RepID=UPI0021A3ED69|nr:hypothetical protein [Levilactobacillus brevis]MCT2886900.1 hypothetical protein [Levilactobacillus brevis]